MRFTISNIIPLLLIAGVSVAVIGCHGNGKPRDCETQLPAPMCAEIAQMLVVGFGGYLQDDQTGEMKWNDSHNMIFDEKSNISSDIRRHVGGVILYSKQNRDTLTGQIKRGTNIQSPSQLEQLNRNLQAYASKVQRPNELPLIIAVDQEGGLVDRLPSELGFHKHQIMILPQALGANEELGFSDPVKRSQAMQATYHYALQLADELAAYHINVNFAPAVDVNINPLNPIIGARGRSFSANPEVVADQAWQFVQALHAKGIMAVLKHFPGHGSSTDDSHDGIVDVTNTYDMSKELEPYRILLQKGYEDPIMTAHLINGQLDKTQCKKGATDDASTWCPGTLSYKTLTGKLRGDLGFKGIIISDDLTMGAMTRYYAPLDFEHALPLLLEKAINAGVDMFIISNHDGDYTQQVINTIGQLVKDGKVKASQIEEANKRIISLKQRMLLGNVRT
ncbi:MAG: glycosyl hydrolase [Gammaproteobacteria bacterium]|jgi:beta-N-acetylhexosaminidase|nr:glycosyl hydrolase [Gammaproteobacteria bacterium]